MYSLSNKMWFVFKHCHYLAQTNVRYIHFGQMMTSQELATALRPFIFVVHPDRFWNYPNEKNTNEVSLKKLNEFLGDKLSQKANTNEQTVTFYMRNNENDTKSVNTMKLTKVDIKLSNRENLNTTVHRILSQCSLSTEYLKKIGKQPSFSQQRTFNQHNHDPLASHQFYRRGNEYFYSKELFDEMESEYTKKEECAPNLTDWLKANHLDAIKKLEVTRPIQNELIRLKQELIADLKLVDLSWKCDWAASHIRGCLQNLSVLSKQYPNDLIRLKDKTVIFSQNSGIGLSGQVVLSIEDVRSSWLDLVRSIKEYDPYIAALPTEVKRLSDLLRDISIVHGYANNVLIARKYVHQLNRFSNTISAFCQSNSFPQTWPRSLTKYKLIVESDSGPLMLSPEGHFIVPSSCPASLFVRFITESISKADHILNREEYHLNQEQRLVTQCITRFGLHAFDKDENITSEQMIDFSTRLLTLPDHLLSYLRGAHIRVSKYYSVLQDGQMCVPYDFLVI